MTAVCSVESDEKLTCVHLWSTA